MKKYTGFTLIEILIALTVFAILATITSSTLYYAFNARTRVNEQAERLNSLQLAISIIQQDTTQTVERPIRGNEMRLFPGFVGQAQYLELTRDGVINPKSIEKRSSLKRIALVCQDGTLIRRTWSSLDPLDRNIYEDKELVNNLSDCYFNYLNQNLQVLSEWREQALAQNQRKEPLPKAIQINLKLNDWGKLNLLFIIPEALYATT
ncbi:type II secretion system minor pseudopilin GspJ [Legionella bononiensis]|uniref:Type II secretion system protein J n=1 Tax=Legionella bononiensis TaxID=2793102 RepID=A0ABS1WBH3_9GAMM|nr:type II secretion system minor pseudopilin GspJ [Legionella bononiensis]MBL7481003.1 GspJ family T2SS minor pseudopilin variant LspJ [Legionella bononiensis]MBL7526711.1 GspJ family T2SS minor pseudopilin variant LspJ [Legionella bononiensis]MBL7564118.1 GspJ family T2SS minor pseudopilin variant LspJ [Legionella bononiensis]